MFSPSKKQPTIHGHSAMHMRLPFRPSTGLWKYADDENISAIAAWASNVTSERSQKQKNLEKRIDNYPLYGPLDPQDTKTKAEVLDLEEKLNDDTPGVEGKWKRRNCADWCSALNDACDEYKPRKRGVSLRKRVRIPCDLYVHRRRRRIITTRRLNILRSDLQNGFREPADASLVLRDVYLYKCMDLYGATSPAQNRGCRII